MNVQPFSPDFADTKSLSVTSISSNVALATVNANTNVLRVTNTGPNVAFVRWGTSAQVALTTDMPILPGVTEVFSKGAASNVAAICNANQTATLYLTVGEGQ